MKKFFSYAVYISLLMATLNFTSCQDEFEIIGGEAEEQPITASSSVAKLIENTSTKDGSFDNIVDGASCFDIKFPYTVEVNGLEITIDSREGLHLIEEIFDEVDVYTDFLAILFPIIINAGDLTEITIDSFEVLRELAAECKEGGDDDDGVGDNDDEGGSGDGCSDDHGDNNGGDVDESIQGKWRSNEETTRLGGGCRL